MPANDRDIWEHFLRNQDTPAEVDFLAYSIYVHEKYDWVKKYERKFGKPPSQAEIDKWIEDITPRRLETMDRNAVALFDNAARRYLADEIEAQQKQAVDQSILREVRSATSLTKQIALAVITAVLTPLILGALVAAAYSYDRFMPSATTVSHSIAPAP